MTNSKRKGAAGEREAAAELARILGCEARRGRQYAGTPDSPDILVDLPGVHWEVKRVERLRLYESLEQAAQDAGLSIPVVLHRASRRPWVAILRLEDLPGLATQVYLQLSR